MKSKKLLFFLLLVMGLTFASAAWGYDGTADFGGVAFILIIAIAIFLISAEWKIYTKAGEHGWACLIPIYNIVVLLRIVNMPSWMVILILIPIVNVFFGIILTLKLGESFGKSGAWSFFLLVFFPVGYLILGYGDATYKKLT